MLRKSQHKNGAPKTYIWEPRIMAKMPDITTFSVHYNILPKTPFSKNTMSRGKVTFPVRGKFTFPFTSFQALLQVLFSTLYTPPFPSPFPLRPPTPTRFPIWESSWIHRGNHRSSIVVPDAVPITVPSPITCCGSLFLNPLQWAGTPGITVF